MGIKMISFKQYIVEVLSGSNHHPYTLNLHKKGARGEVWQYTFNDSLKVDISYLMSNRSWDISLMHDNFGANLVKSKDSGLKSYNTLIAIVREVISPRIKAGDKIAFAAAVPRTQRLYQKFAEMIAKEIDGDIKVTNNIFVVTKR